MTRNTTEAVSMKASPPDRLSPRRRLVEAAVFDQIQQAEDSNNAYDRPNSCHDMLPCSAGSEFRLRFF